MRELVWACRVVGSRWRHRVRYALAAPFVYRNWWAVASSTCGTAVVLELRNGLRFRIRPRSGDLGVVNEAFILNPYLGRGHLTIPANGVVVDVGANIGDFTLQAARQCPDGRVIAVEPVDEHVRILEDHARMNQIQQVTCIHGALGGGVGTTQIAVDGPQSGRRSTASRSEVVRVMTLPALMDEQRLARIDLLKLDCEGAEWDILPAAERVLPRIRQICMEYHCERGWTPDRLAGWLRDRGYRVWHTSGSWNGLLWAVRQA